MNYKLLSSFLLTFYILILNWWQWSISISTEHDAFLTLLSDLESLTDMVKQNIHSQL